jgi:hypothetical protein
MDGYVTSLQVCFIERLLTISGITRKLGALDATAIRQTASFVSDFGGDYSALPDVLLSSRLCTQGRRVTTSVDQQRPQ